jgi:hypothetical protein
MGPGVLLCYINGNIFGRVTGDASRNESSKLLTTDTRQTYSQHRRKPLAAKGFAASDRREELLPQTGAPQGSATE